MVALAEDMRSASLLVACWLGAFATVASGEKVCLSNVDGAIGPATANYISRSIDEAQAMGAQCLILQLNTPGGLLDSTRVIVQKLLGSTATSHRLCSTDGRNRRQRRMFYYPRRECGRHGTGDDDRSRSSSFTRRILGRRPIETRPDHDPEAGKLRRQLHGGDRKPAQPKRGVG